MSNENKVKVTQVSDHMYTITIPIEKLAQVVPGTTVNVSVAENSKNGDKIPHIFLGNRVTELDNVSIAGNGEEREPVPAGKFINGIMSVYCDNPRKLRNNIINCINHAIKEGLVLKKGSNTDSDDEDDNLLFD